MIEPLAGGILPREQPSSRLDLTGPERMEPSSGTPTKPRSLQDGVDSISADRSLRRWRDWGISSHINCDGCVRSEMVRICPGGAGSLVYGKATHVATGHPSKGSVENEAKKKLVGSLVQVLFPLPRAAIEFDQFKDPCAKNYPSIQFLLYFTMLIAEIHTVNDPTKRLVPVAG